MSPELVPATDTEGAAPQMPTALPAALVAMVRRCPPASAHVVPGSTPVVAFGDPRKATVGTIGINPSHREFIENGALLSGTDRRLATLTSLGADRLDRLTDRQVAAVIADCGGYFQRRPYRRWFDPLDRLLRASTATSYYDGTACHLDLIQWATDPTWTHIPDRRIKQRLLDDGVSHLRSHFELGNLGLVLINGRQVLNQVALSGLSAFTRAVTIPRAHGACEVYVGEGSGVRWIGWSTNLQSSYGVSSEFSRRLGESIAELSRMALSLRRPLPQLTPQCAGEASDEYVKAGSRVGSKRELASMLSAWLTTSSTATIGDVGTYGGKPWVHVEIQGQHIVLNADTTRTAVETFVNLSNTDPDLPWRVVANRRGRINKVLPYPHSTPLPGWYAYLTQPLVSEDII